MSSSNPKLPLCVGKLTRSGYDLDDATGHNIAERIVCPDTARRLAACFNACAGIPTEALEAGAVVLRDKRFHIEATEPRA